MRSETDELSRPDRAGLRRFGLVTGLALLLLFGLLLPWLLKRPYPKWPWAPGALLVVSALIAPNALRVIHEPWMRLALLVNRLTTPILAGAVFFLVISPIGWIMRATGNDPMARRFDRDARSYRVPSRVSRPSSMERPF
jgi:hypothetical protein